MAALFRSLCRGRRAVALVALSQHAGLVVTSWSRARVEATLGNPAYLANYMVLEVFVAAFLLARTHRPWSRAALVAAVGLNLSALWFTATRGALVGLLAGVLVAAALVLWRGRAAAVRRQAAAVAVLVVLSGTGLALLPRAALEPGSSMLGRFAAIGHGNVTGDIRLRLWSRAWQGVREHPLLGWGQERYPAVFSLHADPALMRNSEFFEDRAHDLVLDWLVSGGILGAAAYLSLYAASLAMTLRREARGTILENAALGGLVAGNFVTLLFLFDSLMTYVTFVSVLAYLHQRATAARAPKPRAQHLVQGSTAAVIAAVIAVAVAVIFAGDGRGVLACAALRNAYAAARGPQPLHERLLASRDWFRRAIRYGSFGTRDARDAFADAALSVLSHGNDPWVRENFAPDAIDGLAAEVRKHPGDVREMMLLGNVLMADGRFDEGEATFEALALMRSGQAGEAAQELEKLEPAEDAIVSPGSRRRSRRAFGRARRRRATCRTCRREPRPSRRRR